MNIKEAIEHAETKAEKLGDCECAEEHRQLADWLKILDRILTGADKMKRFGILNGHSPLCNYWNAEKNGQKWCNCGYADVVCALEDFEKLKNHQ